MTEADETTIHVKELKIARLERIFSPHGLPLIRKDSKSNVATTVILVRGQAGSGKTTLVAALAHAIGRARDGVALYLSTEALASELRFKSTFLDLPQGAVRGWSRRDGALVGTLLTQHIELTRPGQEANEQGGRRLAAFRAVAEMLDEPGAKASPPVRAVVLDGFLLSDGSPETPDLRHEVISFLQDLEARGITPVLVEEVGQSGLEWLPFVVDLVLELGLEQDSDTGKLIRRLRCPKSRYALCRPGPHDYGLENGRPALWPDLLEVLASGGSLLDGAEAAPPPEFFWPDDDENHYYVLSGPGVIASLYDKPDANILRPHLHTPGTTTLKVVCGSEIQLLRGKEPVALVRENDGPHALAWAVLEHGRDCNFISIGQLPGLMRRRRFRLPLLHLLDALASTGKRVCVHGSEHDLANTDNLGTILFPIERHPGRQRRLIAAPSMLPVARWIDLPTDLFSVEPSSPRDLTNANLVELKTRMWSDTAAQNQQAIPPQLFAWNDDTVLLNAGEPTGTWLHRASVGPATLAAVTRATLLQHRLGLIETAANNFAAVRLWVQSVASPSLSTLLSWASAIVGDFWYAARIIARAMKQDHVDTYDRLLWSCLRLRFVPSVGELDQFIKALRNASVDSLKLCAPTVIETLVRLRGVEAARSWLDEHDSTNEAFAPWYRPYLVAYAGLTMADRVDYTWARKLLADIEGSLDDIRRGEIWYNLGIASARIGDSAEAFRLLTQVSQYHPSLAQYSREQALRLNLR